MAADKNVSFTVDSILILFSKILAQIIHSLKPQKLLLKSGYLWPALNKWQSLIFKPSGKVFEQLNHDIIFATSQKHAGHQCQRLYRP